DRRRVRRPAAVHERGPIERLHSAPDEWWRRPGVFRRLLASAPAGVWIRVEGGRLSVDGDLGRKPEPRRHAVERRDAGARHGVRRVAVPGNAPRDDRARPPVRNADVSLAAGQRIARGGVLDRAGPGRDHPGTARLAGMTWREARGSRIMNQPPIDRVMQVLDSFRIELPSWGFSNTGTRFGKYLQPAAALTIDEKFAD